MSVNRVEIKKNTDQLNFEDFLGGVTRIVTIAGVDKGRKEAQYDIAKVTAARLKIPLLIVPPPRCLPSARRLYPKLSRAKRPARPVPAPWSRCRTSSTAAGCRRCRWGPCRRSAPR